MKWADLPVYLTSSVQITLSISPIQMSKPISQQENPSSQPSTTGKFLTFRVGSESYGIEVLSIREIIRVQQITPVPQMPEHVRGVINLRGKVIPIIDLGIKLALQNTEPTKRTCVIVMDIKSEVGENTFLGIVVDAVEEVLYIDSDQIEPPPDFGTEISREGCIGITARKNGLMTLLDIEKVVFRELSGVLANI